MRMAEKKITALGADSGAPRRPLRPGARIMDAVSALAIRLYRTAGVRRIIRDTSVGRFGAKAYSQFLLNRQDMPRYYNVELTNRCNMRCEMCKNREIPSHRKVFMERGLLQRFMREIDGLGRCWLMLVKQGDALVHPRFPEMLSVMRKAEHRHVITLTTNAYNLNEANVRAVVDNDVDYVNVSIDSVRPETYKAIRGVDLQPVLDNVEALRRAVAAAPGCRTRLSVNMVVMRSNADEVEEAERYWADKCVFLTLQQANVWVLDSAEAGNDNWTLVNAEGEDRYPCNTPFLNMVLNADGTTSLCCSDWNNQVLLGDFNSQTLREIWQGEAYARVRRCHLENDFSDLSLCRDCAQWKAQPNIFFPWQYRKGGPR